MHTSAGNTPTPIARTRTPDIHAQQLTTLLSNIYTLVSKDAHQPEEIQHRWDRETLRKLLSHLKGTFARQFALMSRRLEHKIPNMTWDWSQWGSLELLKKLSTENGLSYVCAAIEENATAEEKATLSAVVSRLRMFIDNPQNPYFYGDKRAGTRWLYDRFDDNFNV